MKNIQILLLLSFLISTSISYSQTSIGPLVGYRFSTFDKNKFLVENYGPEGKYTFKDIVPVFGAKINQHLYKMISISASGTYFNSVLKDYSYLGTDLKFNSISIGLDINVKLFNDDFMIGGGSEANFVNGNWPYIYDYGNKQRIWHYNLQSSYNFNNFIVEAKYFHSFKKSGLQKYFDSISGFQISLGYLFKVFK